MIATSSRTNCAKHADNRLVQSLIDRKRLRRQFNNDRCRLWVDPQPLTVNPDGFQLSVSGFIPIIAVVSVGKERCLIAIFPGNPTLSRSKILDESPRKNIAATVTNKFSHQSEIARCDGYAARCARSSHAINRHHGVGPRAHRLPEQLT